MAINSLTDTDCKQAKPTGKGQKLFDGHGLFLFVTPAGGKSWRMAYRQSGKPQTATLGRYPLLSLAEARKKRDALLVQMLAGQSIKPEKTTAEKKKLLTLEEVSALFWAGRQDLSAGYRMNAENAIARHILPLLAKCPIANIERSQILAALNAMDAAGLSVYVRKTRMWLGQVFDWAVEHNHAATNPCATIDPRKAFSKKPVVSFASIAMAEVPAFMQRLELEGVIQSAIGCKLLALTWVRTAELRGMRWAELDGDTWRISAARMKRRREHLVPLSTQALELIEHMRLRSKGSEFVFPNDRRQDRPMSENAILYLIGRMGYGGKMTGHGLRTVASTWANENGMNRDAIERQLAHAPDDRVRALYNRAEYLPQRRAMLQQWANWLMPGAEANRP